METDADILQRIQRAFETCRRPRHFTDHTHCAECAEHDELLRSRDLHTLRIEDVGKPGRDPICFATSEGFTYYFPALARLALAEPEDSFGWYGGILLFHLVGDGRGNRRFMACTPEQRGIVVQFLEHLVETRAAVVDEHCSADELAQALEIWSEETPAAAEV